MITREDIIKKIQYTNGSSTVTTGHAADSMMELLEPYTTLVDAAVAYTDKYLPSPGATEAIALVNAIKPFLPKTTLSEKLGKLSGDFRTPEMVTKLRQLADEARELEKHRRNGVSGRELEQ